MKNKSHKTIKRVNQVNVHLSEIEMKQFNEINEKYFEGKYNKADLCRMLIRIAIEALASSTVETRTVLMVNGSPVVALE